MPSANHVTGKFLAILYGFVNTAHCEQTTRDLLKHLTWFLVTSKVLPEAGYPAGYPTTAPTYTPNLYPTGSPGYPQGYPAGYPTTAPTYTPNLYPTGSPGYPQDL
ncbi:UNVERIFIED_CONTAM: hypothetical protein FKN15_032973 [Acipenser sinensis]